jgi:hypothetical protein
MLCDFCKQIELATPGNSENGFNILLHHPSIASLRESARAGCPMCYFFDDTFQREALDNIDKAGQVTLCSSHDEDGLMKHIWLDCDTVGLLYYPDRVEKEDECVDFEVFQFEGQCAIQSKVRSPQTQG